MNEAVLTNTRSFEISADKTLKAVGQFWFLAAFIGQFIFAFYIITFYGTSAITGNFELWNSVFPRGYVAGDTLGNIAVALHVIFAAIITLGGPLQLVPQVRAHFPKFHRVNGRVYMMAAFIMALGGIFMMVTRGAVGAFITHVSLAINALLILVFVVQTMRYAIARKIKIHQRWAIRLFLVVSGVWFYRIGLMLWMFIHGGPVGFDMATFSGPFLTFLSFATYLMPLFVFELYLLAKEKCATIGKIVMSAVLLILTCAMAVGIFIAAMGMWLPRIANV